MNGQGVVDPVEALSSPSHISATKGSSVWLHWNYTYIGDGRHVISTLTYREQTIVWKSTSQPSVQTLAKRMGTNGALALASSIRAPFNGRVEVISSNSTLVIHGLQYNDSTFQFSSNVKVDINAGGVTSTYNYHLKPVVSIAVNGMSIVIFLFSAIVFEDFKMVAVIPDFQASFICNLDYLSVLKMQGMRK